MAYRSGLFNSVNGDRKYQAAHFAEYFATFIGNGVFPTPSNSLQVYAKENMTVTIKTGKAWINGYYFVNDSDCDLKIENADGVLKRKDRIVLRFDTSTRLITPEIRKGVFSASPAVPTIQRDADAYELALATISIDKGTVALTQSAITDERLNTTVCGIVHGVVDQVDTATLFSQYQTWYAEKMEQYNNLMTHAETSFNNQLQAQQTAFDSQSATNQSAFDTQTSSNQANFENQTAINQATFDSWFSNIQAIFSGDVVGNILDLIDKHESTLASKDNFGHVKIGENIQVKDGIISVEKVDLSELEIKNSQLIREVAGLKLHQEASERIENGIILADDFTATPINLVIDTAASTNLAAEGLSFLKKADAYINAYQYFTVGTSTSTFGDVKITSDSISVSKKYAWDARSNAIDLTNIKEIRGNIKGFGSLYFGCLAVHTDSNVSWSNNIRKVSISLGWVVLDVSDLVGIHYFGFSSYYQNTNVTQTFNAGDIVLVPLDDQNANFFYEAPSTDEICLFLKPTGNMSLEVYANEVQCKKEKVDEEFLFSAEIPKLETTNIKIAMHSPDGNTTGKVIRILGGINK